MLDRICKLREIIPDGSTAVIITSDVNRFYYSGFRSSAGAVFITHNTAALLVDFRYAEAAAKSASGAVTVLCYKRLLDSINEIIKTESIKSVIIEDNDVTVSQLAELKSCVKAEIVDDFYLSDKILDFRLIKSSDEIEKIKRAQRIAEKSYNELLNFIKPGVTERSLAIELEHLMKQSGAEKVAFDLITISGKNTSLPHGVPSDKKLCYGDFVTFDIGAVYDGYHSDMTRTIALGYASDEMRKVYDIVLNAHNAATKKIRAGNTCADVDNAARGYITLCGYGECFGHTTGHGVGLEIHEKPTVYSTNKTVLKPNMVITNEPGIYLKDKFGVRIEDMYLVTNGGYVDLASIDKELIIL